MSGHTVRLYAGALPEGKSNLKNPFELRSKKDGCFCLVGEPRAPS